SFIHDVAREAIEAALPAGERCALHARCGRFLEERLAEEGGRGAAPVDLAELVSHFEQADEPLRALEYAVRAGDEARALFAARRATACYERALALQERLEP